MSRLVALLAALAVVAAGCAGGASAADCERLPGVRPGGCPIAEEDRQPAPTTAAPLLAEEEGQDAGTLSLADHVGRPVVVNFWASWCGPCRIEQPELTALAERLEGEVDFLGVAVDDTPVNARAFRREFDVPYPSVLDPAGSYAAAFGGIGPGAIPSTVLVDREGRVAVRLFGSTTGEELAVLLDELHREGEA